MTPFFVKKIPIWCPNVNLLLQPGGRWWWWICSSSWWWFVLDHLAFSNEFPGYSEYGLANNMIFTTYCWLSLLACNISLFSTKYVMASHYLAGKESLKEKNYFVIQLVELVQIVFHLISGGTKCKLATYLWFWHTN